MRRRSRAGTAHNITDQLEGLNASLRGEKEGPKRIRRAIERQIEAKAKKKRSHEEAGSSALSGMTPKRGR